MLGGSFPGRTGSCSQKIGPYGKRSHHNIGHATTRTSGCGWSLPGEVGGVRRLGPARAARRAGSDAEAGLSPRGAAFGSRPPSRPRSWPAGPHQGLPTGRPTAGLVRLGALASASAGYDRRSAPGAVSADSDWPFKFDAASRGPAGAVVAAPSPPQADRYGPSGSESGCRAGRARESEPLPG